MEVFNKYADYYDFLYKDKDYNGEVSFIEQLLRKFAAKPVKTILDGGCGTGGHAIPLAKRGFQVTGFDRSKTMLSKAIKKSGIARVNIDFSTNDLCSFNMNKQYDAFLCMFAVMNYITQTDMLLKAMGCIRQHLKRNSLFIFDIWNGLAVMRILPSDRIQIAEDEDHRVIRVANPELDAMNHLCHVHYRTMAMHNDKLNADILETHSMRFYFPQEIRHYLEETGFELLFMCPFMDLDGRVDENSWNITIVAKAA